MSKADFASLKKLVMVDMGRVKHCGDDDIWRCRRMKWTIVLKATESFSNPDPCCQVNTIGQGASHREILLLKNTNQDVFISLNFNKCSTGNTDNSDDYL